MWNFLKRLKPKPKFKYQEGTHFMLVPDTEAVKNQDPHQWNIHFLGRLVKVKSLKIPPKPGEDGQLHVDINAEVLYGSPFTSAEHNQLGDLLMELVQRNLLIRD